ncbi:MAG TPA: hypothetical protein VJH88_04795 [Candidatus Nanoarchaeia archaeon]|nr:hypothetical protein [Candidatus Nanoarchaeia archaeon]
MARKHTFWSKVGDGIAATAKTGLEAVIDGIEAANPVPDIQRGVAAAQKLWHDGVSLDNYVGNLKKGKVLGKGHGATLLRYGGLLGSGAYIGYAAGKAVAGAVASVARNVLTSDAVVDLAGHVSDGAKNTLRYFRNKDRWKEYVTPKIAEASLGLLGYAPVIATMWGAQAANKTGEKLQESRWGIVRGIGQALSGVGSRVNNFLNDYVTISTVSDAYNRVRFSDVTTLPQKVMVLAEPQTYVNTAGTFVQEVGRAAGRLEDIVTSNGAYALGGGLVADITAGHHYLTETDVAQIGKDVLAAAYNKGVQIADGIVSIGTGQRKIGVIVAGFQGNGESFHEADLVHNYKCMKDAGFDEIYVLAPERPNTRLYPDSADVARAFDDNSYSHECTKENLKNIFERVAERADANDVVVTTVYSHGLYRGGHSTCAIDNGNETLYSTELKDMQEPIHAGLELNVVSTCQAGEFAVTAASGTDVITDCRHDQNAQAYGCAGSFVLNEIAKGITNRTNVLDLAQRADQAYSDANFRDGAQDPIVSVGGRVSVIETVGKAQTVKPYRVNAVEIPGIEWGF